MNESLSQLGAHVIQRSDALRAERTAWEGFWQDVAQYVMPRKANITRTQSQPNTSNEQQLFDGTAIRANQILANGKLSWMTPHEGTWFNFDAPAEIQDDDDAKQWFKRCTEIAQATLSRSNFYSVIHEFYLDRGAFGTAVIYCEPGKKNPVTFSCWPVGSYSICEDDEGQVDTCFRELELSARQAAMKFGEENLSADLQKALKSKDPKEQDKKHTFIHGIFPRDPEKIDPRKSDPENMPIASVYVEKKGKYVVRNSGYSEAPFMASRFLTWGNEVYGWSPSWMALPEARQLNFLEKQMDALAELAAFPRFLVPSTHEGDIDLRSSGITYYNPAMPNAIPREWGTAGRYDVGEARAKVKRDAIEEAYHVDLFQMFSRTDKQMTAREVSERSGEKLIQFSPTFARMTTEVFNPLLERVFSIHLRAGLFPPPPESVIVQDESGAYLAQPRVTYNSRIALAIKSLENSAFDRDMEMVLPIAQTRPEILDNYDWDRISRDRARNNGVNADWLLPLEKVQEMRQAKMEAQQAQAQAEQAEMMASAAAKAGSIKPDSAIGQALGDMA